MVASRHWLVLAWYLSILIRVVRHRQDMTPFSYSDFSLFSRQQDVLSWQTGGTMVKFYHNTWWELCAGEVFSWSNLTYTATAGNFLSTNTSYTPYKWNLLQIILRKIFLERNIYPWKTRQEGVQISNPHVTMKDEDSISSSYQGILLFFLWIFSFQDRMPGPWSRVRQVFMLRWSESDHEKLSSASHHVHQHRTPANTITSLLSYFHFM